MSWYKNLLSSYWLRSGIFKMAERVLLIFFAYVFFYVLVDATTKESFGTWTIYISIVTFIELLRMGFISKGLMRCIGKSTASEEYAQVESAALILNIGLSIISSLLLWFGADYIGDLQNSPQLPPLLKIYSIQNFLMLLFYHLDIMQQANMDFKASSIGQSVYKGSQLVFTLSYLFMASSIDLEIIAWLQGISIIIGTAVMYYYGKQYISWQWRPSGPVIREMIHYGKWTFGTNASAILMRNIDSWMLGAFIGPAAVAVYGVALRITNVLDAPVTTLSTIMFPKMIQRIQEEGIDKANYMYEKSVAVILAVILPLVIGIIIFADPIINFIADERYEEAVPVLQITVLYAIMLAFNKQIGTLLDATGRAKHNFLFVLRNTVINIILNYVLIQQYGVIGAASATFTMYIISTILNQLYVNKRYRINPKNYSKYLIETYSSGWAKINSVLLKK